MNKFGTFFNQDAGTSGGGAPVLQANAPPPIVPPGTVMNSQPGYGKPMDVTFPNGTKAVLTPPSASPSMADIMAGRRPGVFSAPAPVAPAVAPPAPPPLAPPAIPAVAIPAQASDPLLSALAAMLQSGDPNAISRAANVLQVMSGNNNNQTPMAKAAPVDPYAFDESSYRSTRSAELLKEIKDKLKSPVLDENLHPKMNGRDVEYQYPDDNDPNIQFYLNQTLNNEVLSKKLEIQNKQLQDMGRTDADRRAAELEQRTEREVSSLVARAVHENIPSARTGDKQVDAEVHSIFRSVFDAEVGKILDRLGERYNFSTMKDAVFAEAIGTTKRYMSKFGAGVNPAALVPAPTPAPIANPVMSGVPTPLGAPNAASPYAPPPSNAPAPVQPGTAQARAEERKTLRSIINSRNVKDVAAALAQHRQATQVPTTPTRI